MLMLKSAETPCVEPESEGLATVHRNNRSNSSLESACTQTVKGVTCHWGECLETEQALAVECNRSTALSHVLKLFQTKCSAGSKRSKYTSMQQTEKACSKLLQMVTVYSRMLCNNESNTLLRCIVMLRADFGA